MAAYYNAVSTSNLEHIKVGLVNLVKWGYMVGWMLVNAYGPCSMVLVWWYGKDGGLKYESLDT